MKYLKVFVWMIAPLVLASEGHRELVYPELETYIERSISEFDRIDTSRKKVLAKISSYIKQSIKNGQTAQLTFICTHNSRRSHMSQIWAQAAAAYYRIPGVQTYSGGTEATAFNPRVVTALQRTGFRIDRTTDAVNPVYHVRFHEEGRVITAFSKIFNQAPNPVEDFCAVMTCSQADAACPAVAGATARIAIPYDDPKIADNTPGEAAKYDERCRQISREMLFIFSKLSQES